MLSCICLSKLKVGWKSLGLFIPLFITHFRTIPFSYFIGEPALAYIVVFKFYESSKPPIPEPLVYGLTAKTSLMALLELIPVYGLPM